MQNKCNVDFLTLASIHFFTKNEMSYSACAMVFIEFVNLTYNLYGWTFIFFFLGRLHGYFILKGNWMWNQDWQNYFWKKEKKLPTWTLATWFLGSDSRNCCFCSHLLSAGSCESHNTLGCKCGLHGLMAKPHLLNYFGVNFFNCFFKIEGPSELQAYKMLGESHFSPFKRKDATCFSFVGCLLIHLYIL